MPLKGIKVLELAGLAPVPYCGMVLADFGAAVTRIDRINGNVAADCLAHGKKAIALNLKHEEGVKILLKLSKEADVLIEPYRMGVMESLGLGPKILLNANPRLIYARLTGFGQNGYYGKQAGHDLNYIAISGLLSLFGRHNDKPIFPLNTIADFAAGGLMCALGIVMALHERNSSGLGQVVDCSMTAASAYLGSWFYRGQDLPLWGNPRGKNIIDSGAHFYEVYETKDGKYMAVGALEPQFYDLLLKGLDLKEENVPQYANFEENKKLFSDIFLTKTQDEWCKVFDKSDACVTPVLTLNDAIKHPHNVDQGTFIEHLGKAAPMPTPKLSRTPGVSQAVNEHPGGPAHTQEVLKKLGYSDKDILKLENDGTVQMSPMPQSKL